MAWTFSDSIEATFLTSVYVTRESDVQDSSGNFVTAAVTVTSGMQGDVQPAPSGLFHAGEAGADYRITHRAFCDVPSSIPAEGDTLVDGGVSYTVRLARNFKSHIEFDLERLGV